MFKLIKNVFNLFKKKKSVSSKPDKRRHQKKSTHQKQHRSNQNRSKIGQKNHKTQEKRFKGTAFSKMGLHPKLVEQLSKRNFDYSTKVQETSIPETLSGKNIFCSSETGSGKTLSFLLPMIHKFYHNEISQGLIVCPTREIAIQIQKALTEITNEEISSALVIGGTNVAKQKKELATYPQVLVATPGRLLDMLNTGLIWLEYTDYVVLDEADRMLDMGFEPDLIKIHEQLSGNHQTILFSATLFPEIKKMANRYANDFKEIVIGNPTRVANSVTHVLVELAPGEKESALRYLMSKNRGKMIVFFNSIKDTSTFRQKMRRVRGSRVDAIHSKIDQSNRESIIENFRSNRINTLMASDIASRGIDIPNVDLVINFDIPYNSEEYIHRVGRTGRAGQTGLAISFYTYKDKKRLDAVQKLIKGKIKQVKSYRDIL